MNLQAPQAKVEMPPADKNWWRGAVIYQIYPRSFQDSNGDGIGDLGGIVQRLDHVASLGADAIWISPFFPSPMLDFGYDVTNYRGVDPIFGTLADFDRLIARAHDLGIKVLIDLVLSHTSDQHPWFGESRADHDNPRADWYVWADAKPDGTPPNNWLSIFGGSAWEWDAGRLQYYLHNFLTSQPDLNFHCMQVQDALLDVARFWLDRGVDGFRFDTINFYVHDKELRDNPALPPERRDYSTAPAVNPYNHQEHLYDKSRPETLDFLRRMRAVMEEYPAIAAVGEVADAQRGMEIMGAYTTGGDKMHMCYAFEFLSGTAPSGTRVAEVLRRFMDVAAEGWVCWAFSNHDVVRHVTRWGLDDAKARVFLALILSLRGSVCLYQGEELGLTEVDIAFEDLRDPYGIRFWPRFAGRDGCRTPMVWSEAENDGFSRARPWLPIAPEHRARAVRIQEGDPDSMLACYRRLIAFRSRTPALVHGGFALHTTTETVVSYLRELEGAAVFCALNLGDEPARVDLPPGMWRRIEGTGFEAQITGAEVDLPPNQALFAERG